MAGPIYKHDQAKKYLEENNIPKLFECLIASIMIEKPDDLYNYLDKQIEEIKEIGLDKVKWDTFIEQHHPSKDPKRLELIQDELSLKIKRDQAVQGKEGKDATHEPEVFNLTEPQDDEEP